MLFLSLLQLAHPFLILSLESLLPLLESALHLGIDDILAACTLQVQITLGMIQPLCHTAELLACHGEFLLQSNAFTVVVYCCSHAFYHFYLMV